MAHGVIPPNQLYEPLPLKPLFPRCSSSGLSMVCDIIPNPRLVFPFSYTQVPSLWHHQAHTSPHPIPMIPNPTTYARTNPYTNVQVKTNPLSPSIKPPVHSVHPLTKYLVVSSSAAAVERTRKTYTSAEVRKVRRA